MKDIDLIHELAIIEDKVRQDLDILASDPRPAHDRSDWSKGFDGAVLSYAVALGLLRPSQVTADGWFI